MSLPPRPSSAECGRASFLRKLARLLACVAVFGLMGPPVGGLVAWGSMGMRAMQSPVPFVSGSYGEGILLALATGAMVAAAAWFGNTSWIVAVGAAVLANAAMHLATAIPDLSDAEQVAGLARVAAVFLPSSVVAALVCWFAARPLLRTS